MTTTQKRPPSHGWTAANAILVAAPYTPAPWLRELHAREQRRQERIAAWRASQAPVDRGPRKKFEPRGQDPRLPMFVNGDVPPGGTPEEIRAFNDRAFGRDLAWVRSRKDARAAAAPSPTPAPLNQARIVAGKTRIDQTGAGQGNGDRALAVGRFPLGFRP